MLALLVYLTAVAGLTAFCYAFLQHDEGEHSDEDKVEPPEPPVPMEELPSTSKVSDQSPVAVKHQPLRVRARSCIRSRTRAKVRDVLAFVNTPSDELLKETASHAARENEKRKAEKYCSFDTPQSKAVISGLKKSQERVEAWITQIDQVINVDDKHLTGKNHGQETGSVRQDTIPASHHINNTRNDRGKEEVGKRQEIPSAKTEQHYKRNTLVEPMRSAKNSLQLQEKMDGRKRLLQVTKRDASRVTDVSNKRPSDLHDQDNLDGVLKKRPPVVSLQKPSRNTFEERNVFKQARNVEQGRPSSNRLKAISQRSATEHKPEVTSVANSVADRTRMKYDAARKDGKRADKIQGKQMSCFETRMKYGVGYKFRPSSPPTRGSNNKLQTSSPSRIPVRPPVPRAIKLGMDSKQVTSAKETTHPTTKKNFIEITAPRSRLVECGRNVPHVPSLPSLQSLLPTKITGNSSTNECEAQKETTESDSHERAGFHELSVIGVRGSQSQCFDTSDIRTELSYAKELATRIAKSGPLNVSRSNSLTQVKSHSYSSLSAVKMCQQRPAAISTTFRKNDPQTSVSKTAAAHQDAETNLTVYFSVTVPRVPVVQSSRADLLPEVDVGGTSDMGVGTEGPYKRNIDDFETVGEVISRDGVRKDFYGGPRGVNDDMDESLEPDYLCHDLG